MQRSHKFLGSRPTGVTAIKCRSPYFTCLKTCEGIFGVCSSMPRERRLLHLAVLKASMIVMTLRTDVTIYTCECPAHHRLWHYQNAIQHPRLTAIFLLPVNTPLTTSPFQASLVEIHFFWEEARRSWENKAFPSGKTAEDLIKTGTKVMTNLKPHIAIMQLKQRDY